MHHIMCIVNVVNIPALSALVYSTALSKGCSSGSRFLCSLRTSCDLSRVQASSDLFMAFTFILIERAKSYQAQKIV